MVVERRSGARVMVFALLAVVVGSALGCPPADVGSPDSLTKAVCWHIDGSRYECPDSTGSRTMMVSASAISRVSMVVTLTDGREERFSVPANVDAIFLTPGGLQILREHYLVTDTTKAAEVGRIIDWASRTP
jgi:hypothetical protein